MPDLGGSDPRDAVLEAAHALGGLVDLLTECDRPVQRRGLEAILRLIRDQLEPAAEQLLDYVPRDFTPPRG